MVATAGLGAAASFAAVGVGFLPALTALSVRQAEWTLQRGICASPSLSSSSSDVDDATLAVVFPRAAAPLAAMVVSLGINAFYPEPMGGETPSAWLWTVSQSAHGCPAGAARPACAGLLASRRGLRREVLRWGC